MNSLEFFYIQIFQRQNETHIFHLVYDNTAQRRMRVILKS